MLACPGPTFTFKNSLYRLLTNFPVLSKGEPGLCVSNESLYIFCGIFVEEDNYNFPQQLFHDFGPVCILSR